MTTRLAKTIIKVTGALKDSFQFVHGMFILFPFVLKVSNQGSVTGVTMGWGIGNQELVTGVTWTGNRGNEDC